jgi:hypothetical protein
MKLKNDENLIVVSNKAKDLNEVLDTLASKDSKKVAAYLVEYTSLPREMRMAALRLVLNDYVKIAKDLVLSDEFMYRLNWYEKFSETQLVKFWNVLETSNSDVFNSAEEAVRFKKTFYLLLLKNASVVDFTDKELENLLELETPGSTLESFKEFMDESNGAFYDYECNFDGMSFEDFKTTLKKCSTVADIRNIAAKYDINVPKRLKKEELVAIVLEGLRRQGKADENTEAQLKKMSAITLQRHAKVNGIKASTEMKKDDIIEFIMNRLDSSSKAVTKPRVQLETLPELQEFKFSKDYLREVAAVVDEEDEAPVAETPVQEEVQPEPVQEEVVEEVQPEPVQEEVVEEVQPETVEEEPVVEEVQPEPVQEEVEESQPEEEYVEAETEIVEEVEEVEAVEPVEEEPVEPVTSQYNDQLLETIIKLLSEREERDVVNQVLEDNRFNSMVELYEKRMAHLEEMIKELIKDIHPIPTPINLNITYPQQEVKQVVESEPVPVVEEPVQEEVVEENVVEESSVTPVVMDPTFDTMSPEETEVYVKDEMRLAADLNYIPGAGDEESAVVEEVHARNDRKGQAKLRKIEKKRAKIERIRAKNDMAVYKRAKRRAFWNFVKAVIIIAILLVLAVFTLTTLTDMQIITGAIIALLRCIIVQLLHFSMDIRVQQCYTVPEVMNHGNYDKGTTDSLRSYSGRDISAH